jgi:hypothetical protein
MTRRRIAPLAIAALMGLAGGASGQVTGTLDVGAGTYRPDRAIPGGIASIAPTLVYERQGLRFGATGVYSDAPAGRWNFQGTGFAQVHTPRVGIFEAELGGELDATRHFRAQGTHAVTGDLRLYAHPMRGISLWVSRGLGASWTLDRRRPLRRTQVGTSTQLGGMVFGLSVASTSFDLMGGPTASPSDTLVSGGPRMPTQSASNSPDMRTSLTDAVFSTSWRIASFDLDLALGRRFSRNAPEMTIWGVSAARSLSSQVALVGGAGRSGADPVTAVPGAKYLVFGLRLKLGPAAAPVFNWLPPPPEDSPLRIGPALPAGREILIRVPGAKQVELAGDFTDWAPVALQQVEDSGWRAVLPIAPGLHRMAIRIDQGAWRPPPGTRPVRNEFGGDVAEIVVE